MNLMPVMELGGRSLLRWLDPDHGRLPTGGWLESHDTGRWWDAMLRLEHATGFVIPPDLESAMLRNLQTLTDNPDHLLFIPPGLACRAPRFELHSLRECLLAFSALVRYRGSAWAARRGRDALATIRRCLRADGSWDLDRFAYPQHAGAAVDRDSPSVLGDMTGTTGRCIEGLVEFHEATGDALALELADEMARYHLEHSTAADGSMPPALVDSGNAGHSHSYLGTLRGLWRFGRLTRQHEYVDAVQAAYDGAVQQHVIDESGFTPHDLGKTRYPDEHGDPIGETASAGDVAQLALWLGARRGDARLLDDAERILRSRLLPGQTSERDATDYPGIAEKNVGGWGAHAHPHGAKGVILDVTAAVVHTLVDLYEHAVEHTDAGWFVNLHLDRDDEAVSVRVTRAEERAAVALTAKRPIDLFVRIPRWTQPASVHVSLDGTRIEPRLIGPFVHLPATELGTGRRAVMRYSLPMRETAEVSPAGRRFSFTWRGDQIVAMQPAPDRLPFYPG